MLEKAGITASHKFLVTGGAGFIGSAVVRILLNNTQAQVLNVDKLTYASDLRSLKGAERTSRYQFLQADVADHNELSKAVKDFAPTHILNIAAETHVDRSIDSPESFINSNILGAYSMLEVARRYWSSLDGQAKSLFRFVQVSTDEVFGSLGDQGMFDEKTPYNPSSPYSASKAAADMLAHAWGRTFELPVVVTNCSNNYGPFQFPEKLIPLMILNASEGRELPVYGDGSNVRDWLYVEDHAIGILMAATMGNVGQSYLFGGGEERSNLEVVDTICSHLDKTTPGDKPRSELIKFVEDRPGHDYRYAIDYSKATADFGWHPTHSFDKGLLSTVRWYLSNQEWWQPHRLEHAKPEERLGRLT